LTITAVDLVCPSIVKRGLGREKKNGHLKAQTVVAAERNSIKEVDCIQARFLEVVFKNRNLGALAVSLLFHLF